MATQATRYTGPRTVEALLAERQRFWGSFTSATTIVVVFAAIVLALMGLFLL